MFIRKCVIAVLSFIIIMLITEMIQNADTIFADTKTNTTINYYH